jgi:NH3-dependent NAD+ synthetase
MDKVRTDIIPVKPQYVGVEDEIDYKAICFFAATNFFLTEDTYFKGKKCLLPGREYEINDGRIISEKKWFEWTYEPRSIDFEQAVDEFSESFEQVSYALLKDKKVILPLSGGLDSRTQAVALKGREDVYSYSYQYPNGVNETEIAGKVAEAVGFEFERFFITPGYLWNKIDQIAKLIEFSGDVTSPRQASVTGILKNKGDIFYLGHWGDVLFDDMGISEDASFSEVVEHLKKKILKKGGVELADSLWKVWGLSGDFESELTERLKKLLSEIKIENNNARIRAFKSLYWAPRWTSIYLSVFSDVLPLAMPYYHEKMCRLITTLPEEFLAGRKIQIEYIKRKSVEAASVAWQPYAPYNLYNFQSYYSKTNLFRRAYKKAGRVITGKNIIQRNWEIQFLGKENEIELKNRLFGNDKFKSFVPGELVKKYFDAFNDAGLRGKIQTFHQVSTLLTLSMFAQHKL